MADAGYGSRRWFTPRVVGTGHDDDRVLATALQQDERLAGLTRGRAKQCGLDSAGDQRRAQGRCMVVCADLADEPGGDPQPCRSRRLIGPLPARTHGGVPPGDGLTALGQAVDGDIEVGVDGTEDEQRCGHCEKVGGFARVGNQQARPVQWRCAARDRSQGYFCKQGLPGLS